jgi:hypothetical protein
MTDEADSGSVINRSGGADLNAQGDINVGGDVVGRDKTVQQAEGSNIAQAAGPNAVATVISADLKKPLGIVMIAALVPYLCVSTWLARVSLPPLAPMLLCCMSPFPIGTLVASLLLRNRAAIILSLLALVITFYGFWASWSR